MTAATAIPIPGVPSLNAAFNPGLLFGLAAVAMWASYLAYARAGVNAGLEPQDFVFLRYATAGAIMAPWLLRHQPMTLAGVGWRRGAVLALLAGPVFIFLGVGGYLFAPLSHGAVVQPATVTLASMAIAWAFLGERMPGGRLAGVGVIIAGLVLIATGKSGAAGEGAWIGDLLFMGAGLFWAVFTVLLKRWGVGGIGATAIVSVLSAIVVVPAFMIFGTFERLAALDLATLTTQIVVQGVFSGVIAVIAFGKAVEHLGASKAALFPALVPAAALIAGMPITGEMPSVAEWAGAALASLGLAVAMGVVRLPKPRPASARDPHSTR
ncbi:MAG: DMT family transporter [Alphaproteobacteria bacterium]